MNCTLCLRYKSLPTHYDIYCLERVTHVDQSGSCVIIHTQVAIGMIFLYTERHTLAAWYWLQLEQFLKTLSRFNARNH